MYLIGAVQCNVCCCVCVCVCVYVCVAVGVRVGGSECSVVEADAANVPKPSALLSVLVTDDKC